MKKIKFYIFISLGLYFFSGCNDYLDVVPDNIATLDHAFRNRASAESYLFTCYSYLPNPTSPETSPSLLTGDDMMTAFEVEELWYPNVLASRISLGQQNVNNPYLNYWDGGMGGQSMFQAIRDCNIFLEEMPNGASDMEATEKAQWIAEVKSLKAYYHFFLLRLYGPIPIIKDNLGLNASVQEVAVYREPVNEVVDYICELLEEAVPDLPLEVQFATENAGRITRPIALSLIAQARLWDASPLFNGNSDYASFKDNRGVQLVSQQFSEEKWTLASDAAKKAIEAAESAGHALFKYESSTNSFSDSTKTKLDIRGAFSEPWNSEIIWGDTHNTDYLQRHSQPRFAEALTGGWHIWYHHAATLRMAELFYTNNGIPLKEDPTYFNQGLWYDLKNAEVEDRYYIAENFRTASLNFKREPRFYANLGFDGSTWYGNAERTDNNLYIIRGKSGQPAGFYNVEQINVTGYYPKKYLHYETVLTANSWTQKRYSFPIIRLADLYLMYAEALNESQGPSSEVFQYLNEIRSRAGLDGVEESWANSTNPTKPTTKEGLREIIRQERMIELAFEGSRFYDLRRWKLASEYFNRPMKGWNYVGATDETYYQVKTLRSRSFTQRDYLWPIKLSNLYINSNLIQNPGWE